VAGTHLVQAFDDTELTMFLAPCLVGGRQAGVVAARARLALVATWSAWPSAAWASACTWPLSGNSDSVLYAVAGCCALAGAAAILPV
jgi:hypothetical protein